MQEDPRIFFFLSFFFFLSKCQLRSSFTRLLHLHVAKNVHENLCVCVFVCVCVSTYVRVAVTYMTPERGRSGREITASCDGKIV